jgi:uncharacterized protein (TIGR02246 family)
MHRVSILTGLVVAILAVGFMAAQDRKYVEKVDKAPDPKREADKQAIDKLVQDMVQAFNNKDAAALVANWSDDGEYSRNDDVPFRSKAEIEKGYANYFKTLKGKPKIEVQIDGLRFPSRDSAYSEVTLRLKNEEGEVIASSWRNTLLVREDGRWKVAIVSEWDRDETADTNLKELEWLIGTWQASNKDREVTTSFEWDENKAFIRGKFSVKEGGKVIQSGTQMITKDKAEGAIRSWVFQSDGGFGDGLWTRDGKKWTVDLSGVTADGRSVTANTIYIHLDANTFTWQAVDQEIDGLPIADTQPIKVSKRKGK